MPNQCLPDVSKRPSSSPPAGFKETQLAGIGVAVLAGLSFLIVLNVAGALEANAMGSGLVLTGFASLFAAIAGFKVFRAARRQ